MRTYACKRCDGTKFYIWSMGFMFFRTWYFKCCKCGVEAIV